jgi:hypothetical protein
MFLTQRLQPMAIHSLFNTKSYILEKFATTYDAVPKLCY